MRFYPDFNTEQLTKEYVSWTTYNGVGRNQQDLRFGQYICNQYLVRYYAFPELFYEEDAAAAYKIALQELNG